MSSQFSHDPSIDSHIQMRSLPIDSGTGYLLNRLPVAAVADDNQPTTTHDPTSQRYLPFFFSSFTHTHHTHRPAARQTKPHSEP